MKLTTGCSMLYTLCSLLFAQSSMLNALCSMLLNQIHIIDIHPQISAN